MHPLTTPYFDMFVGSTKQLTLHYYLSYSSGNKCASIAYLTVHV